LAESLEFEAYAHRYRLLAVWEVFPDAPPDDPTRAIGGSALLYQMDGGAPQLRWSEDYLSLLGQAPYLAKEPSGYFPAPPPGDWNGDGKVEFGVRGTFMGTAWFTTILYVYQIEPDGTVVSKLEGVIRPVTSSWQRSSSTTAACC
jgi:hypothetical protein